MKGMNRWGTGPHMDGRMKTEEKTSPSTDM